MQDHANLFRHYHNQSSDLTAKINLELKAQSFRRSPKTAHYGAKRLLVFTRKLILLENCNVYRVCF